MSRVAVVVPLRPEAAVTAKLLIEDGPPFALEDTPLEAHAVYLTDDEAVFVFEGPEAREIVAQLVGEAGVWEAATAWRACAAGKPRVAEPAFAWHRG
jgi:hypothetical protein